MSPYSKEIDQLTGDRYQIADEIVELISGRKGASASAEVQEQQWRDLIGQYYGLYCREWHLRAKRLGSPTPCPVCNWSIAAAGR
jgi:hypothetical protein